MMLRTELVFINCLGTSRKNSTLCMQKTVHVSLQISTVAFQSYHVSVRARIVQLTQTEGEAGNVVAQEVFGVQEPGKSSRKAIQMGQKLRTALRGPPVFRDGSKFRLSRLLEGHKDGVWHVAADSTRHVCASASADQTARVWSLESGTCLATYLGHTGSVNCVAISTNCAVDTTEGSGTAAGLLLATASGDESAHVWRVPSNNGKLIDNLFWKSNNCYLQRHWSTALKRKKRIMVAVETEIQTTFLASNTTDSPRQMRNQMVTEFGFQS